MNKILIIIVFFLATSFVFAGGYRISMQGGRQLAMGHSGVAVIGNAETMFFNPAASVYLEETYNFSAGVTVLFADTKFQNELYNWSSKTRNIGTPLYFYGAAKLNSWITLGLAVYTPYGSSVKWDKDWEGSHLVNNINLKAFYFQPTLALKLSDNVSLGGGFIIVNGGVEFNRNLGRNLADEEGNRSNITIKASNVRAYGFTAGFLVKLTEDFILGYNYRSEITMSAKGGDATFYNLPAFAKDKYKNTTFSADLPLPAEITAGLSYRFNKWLFAFDYNSTYWSAYNALVINFDSDDIEKSYNVRNYKNSSVYRFGLQYEPIYKLSIRGGIYYDESPVRDGYFAPETPRNSGIGYTGGFTYNINRNIGIDVVLSYLDFKETNNSYDHFVEDGTAITFGGTYLSSVFSAGLGLSYSF